MAKKRVRVVLYGPSGGAPVASVWADMEQHGTEGGHRITLLFAYTDLRPARGWQFTTSDRRYQIEGSVEETQGSRAGDVTLLCREVAAASVASAAEEDR